MSLLFVRRHLHLDVGSCESGHSFQQEKKICFSLRSQGLVTVFHLHLSEFLDLGLSHPNAILFCLYCKALWPLVNNRNVSAVILLLEENAAVRREASTQYAVLHSFGELSSDCRMV